MKKLALISVFLLAACAAPATSNMVPFAPSDLSSRLLSSGITHLYVSDIHSHKVLRFALRAGIPNAQPDLEIGAGLSAPSGIAIGPDRRLYVIDKATKQLVIFTPNSGTPVRTLALSPRNGLSSIAVDSLGYVYVGYVGVCTTEGFYCGNVDVFSPLERGLHLVGSAQLGLGGSTPASSQVLGLTVNSSKLFATDFAFTPTQVYNNAPFFTSFFPLCGGAADAGAAWGPSDTLYVSDVGSGQSQAEIVVTPHAVAPCPAYFTITSATTPLQNPLQIAAGNGLVYVSSAYSASAGSALVFVFDPSVPGRQTPLAILQGSKTELKDIRGLAIGQ